MKVAVVVLAVYCASGYAQIFIPNCSYNELKTLWPYYENNHYYYNCLAIGQSILVRCNGYTLFNFEKQSCTGQGAFIPPPDPENLPTEFPPTNGNPTTTTPTTVRTTITTPSTSTTKEILHCTCPPITNPPTPTTQLTDAPTVTLSTIPGPSSPTATDGVPVPSTQGPTPPVGIGPPTPVPTVKMK